MWHKGNQKFLYATIEDIWINGWLCCEGYAGPELPKDKHGIFTKREELENFGAFMANANWEIVAVPKGKTA